MVDRVGCTGPVVADMLTVTKLRDAEYVLGSVALGVEEYYVGEGEAPGVWTGRWAAALGLEGMVEADDLRALLDGRHPLTGADMTAGQRDRTVRAIDLTFSAPKTASVLWALGSHEVAATVMASHGEAVAVALTFLEQKASVTRRQVAGVRTQVGTEGLAVAAFVHRTSREGDPQLHSHCLAVNLTQRRGDGRIVALDARPVFDWARAAGSVYQAELQRLLSLRLGVVWGPDRHNTREIAGISPDQARAFSKRTAQIEAELEQIGAAGADDAGLRARLDDAASLATRTGKDRALTPTALIGRWEEEAGVVGLKVGVALDRQVCFREPDLGALSFEEATSQLVDPDLGLCARSPRFDAADVIEHLCGLAAGRLTVADIESYAARFIASDLVVRLTPSRAGFVGRRLAAWSTVAHRQAEDRVLTLLEIVTEHQVPAVTGAARDDVLLGADQRAAVEMLCKAGPAVRAVLAPAGFGKTAMVAAAASRVAAAGRRVLGTATTAKAVAELDGAGLPALTIAALRRRLHEGPLAPGTVVVLDEVSQTSTRDAETVLAAVAACPGSQLWILGDPRQGQAVLPGGLAAEIANRADAATIPSAVLDVNRRQLDPADRAALVDLRAGHVAVSQTTRRDRGWEHDHGTPDATRTALAAAAVADMHEHGLSAVAVLTVSHVDAEDLADRIRGHLVDDGFISGGAVIEGPGWAGPRAYATGDRVLFHTRCAPRGNGIVNGTTATVTAITPLGLTVRPDATDATIAVDVGFVKGTRPDGSPNLSHAWARTVDGAQGGTWTAAHLLGTPALDQYRGYVGQSRSRIPTHTWNTTPGLTLDHGGVLADHRDAGERVLAALTRTPDPTMAAASDPTTEDRRLRDLIGHHLDALHRRPADQTYTLSGARVAANQARERLDQAIHRVADLDEQLADFGPLRRLTPTGRNGRHDLVDRRVEANRQFDEAVQVAHAADKRLTELESANAAVSRFDAAEGWRIAELKRLREELSEHWTRTALDCVHGEDPLAHGIDVLRRAFAHRNSQLRKLDAGLPADRSTEERRTAAELARVIATRRRAAAEATAARQRLETAAGMLRRRPDDIDQGRRELDRAVAHLRDATTQEGSLRLTLEEIGSHQDQRRTAVEATAAERGALLVDQHELSTALQATLADRVNAHALDPPDHLLAALGDIPETDVGRAVWCHYAAAIEAELDSCKTGLARLGQPHTQALRHIDAADRSTGSALVAAETDPDSWAAVARAIPVPPLHRSSNGSAMRASSSTCDVAHRGGSWEAQWSCDHR
jgi:conjugative relaxase-like TrwC/TraI family protein